MVTSFSAEREIKEKYVDYQGVKIYTEAYKYCLDVKEAIIFLHGIGASHTHGEFLYDASNPYMTITLDYLDHGNSGHIPVIGWEKQLESIKVVLEAYSIEEAHVVGHSFGADVAMMFSKKYPNMVKDIVLLDRAYFKYKDYEEFNVTKTVMNILEYVPKSALSFEEFLQFLNISWDNEIAETWNIKKDVLLLAANGKNFTGNSLTKTPSLSNFIAMIKECPSRFGMDVKDACSLPDITEKNVSDLVDFLQEKIYKFNHVNKRFSVIQTSFTHSDMIRNPDAKNSMRSYVLRYITNSW